MEITSLFVGILGIALSMFFGYKARRMERKITRYHWDDVYSAIDYIHQTAIRKYRPSVILTVSMPGTIVASVMLARFGLGTPLIVGQPYKAGETARAGDLVIKTSKWHIALPEQVANLKGKRILVVDGATLTGDTIQSVSDFLVEFGIERENIRWACLLATELSVEAGKAPDYFRFLAHDSKVYLPWGRVLGPGL